MSFKLISTLFTIALLLSSLADLTYAARPEPAFPGDSLAGVKPQKVEVDESCEGVEGKEECLMRRTLAAHLDYIYTQKHKP
ncbi:phytosulfokines-like [Juglans microcarpa x Juglans regia]|uniref:phytosulfokines-like n=1 Tax=Juglans microcarpa x Juglans regia TaxID=2249226 RepID=UPI001B7E011C|nr:phytosulfokines-like [Juglans microcarpa x Juglans regia]